MTRPSRLASFLLAAAFAFGTATNSSANEIAITGRVVDESGGPIAGASVTLRALLPPYEEALAAFADEEPEPLVATLTDERGEYRLAAPRIGPYQLWIDVPKRVVVRLDLLPLLETQRLPPVTPPRDAGLEVRVLGADGSGVAGARIELLGRIPEAIPSPWMLRTVAWTDEAGRARLPSPTDRRAAFVRAHVPLGADAWWPLEARPIESDRTTFRVPKDAAQAVEIFHLRRGGRPAPDALLVEVPLPGLAVPIARPDAEGRLLVPRLDGSIRESLRLVTEEGGVAWAELALQTSNEANGDAPPVLEVPAPTTVLGRVVDGRGTPVAEAFVWAIERSGVHAYTGSDGVFELERPGAGGFGVAHPDFLPRRLDPVPPGDEIADLALSASVDLRARVVDAEGRAVADAAVALRHEGAWEPGAALAVPALAQRVRGTDAEGRVVLRHLVPGDSYQVEIEAPGFVRRSVRHTVPIVGREAAPNDEASEVTWTLSTGRSVVGRVVDPDGEPVPGARITGRADSNSRPDDPATTTGEDGRFALGGLPEERAQVAVSARGFVERQWPLPAAETPDDEGNDTAIDLGDLALEAGAEVAGRVVDTSGRGIANALVVGHVLPEGRFDSVLSFRADAEADGRFTLEGLPTRGRLELSVHVANHGSAERSIDLPADGPIEIRLEASTRLSGHVVGPDGQRLGGVSVRAVQSGPGGGTSSTSFPTDAAGEFVYEQARPGRVTLDASTAELYLEEPVEIDLAPGEPVDGVELRLVAGGVLEGTVLDADGVGAVGAMVGVRRAVERSTRSSPPATVTDGAGRFRLGGLAPGPAFLVAQTADGRTVRREIEIEPGVRTVEIELPGNLRLAGVVVAEDGRPLVGLAVGPIGETRDGPPSLGPTASTDAQGRFELTTPGPVAGFRLEAPGAVARVHHFAEPLTSDRDDLRVELVSGTMLEGRLRVPTNQLGEAHVNAVCARPDRAADAPIGGRPLHASASVDAEGRFRIHGLVPCTWSVGAMVGDQQIRRAVRVDPGMVTVEVELEPIAGYTITGRVTLDGEPFVDAHLNFVGPESSVSARVDAEGRFVAENVPEGEIRIVIFGPRGGQPEIREKRIVGDEHLEIEVDSEE